MVLNVMCYFFETRVHSPRGYSLTIPDEQPFTKLGVHNHRYFSESQLNNFQIMTENFVKVKNASLLFLQNVVNYVTTPSVIFVTIGIALVRKT